MQKLHLSVWLIWLSWDILSILLTPIQFGVWWRASLAYLCKKWPYLNWKFQINLFQEYIWSLCWYYQFGSLTLSNFENGCDIMMHLFNICKCFWHVLFYSHRHFWWPRNYLWISTLLIIEYAAIPCGPFHSTWSHIWPSVKNVYGFSSSLL